MQGTDAAEHTAVVPMLPSDRPVRSDNLEVHRVEDGCVVYVVATAEVHFLNDTALYVFDRCDGSSTVAELQQELDAFSTTPFDLRDGILAQFERSGLISAVAGGHAA